MKAIRITERGGGPQALQIQVGAVATALHKARARLESILLSGVRNQESGVSND